MKTKLLILTALLMACETQQFGESSQNGYLSYSGSIPDLSTFKAVVPECSDFTPDEVYIKLIKPINGSTYSATAPIIIQGNQIASDGEMIFPEGDYQVDEVSLMYNGIITHTAPYENDPRYDFGRYVDRTLPYNLTITPGQTTTTTNQVLCYTEETIELDGNFEWVGEVIELKTMYFYIPATSCIQYVTLEIDFYRIVEIPIFETGLQSLPIPANFNFFALRGYLDDNNPNAPIQSFTGTEYNADGQMDQDDVLFFGDNCN